MKKLLSGIILSCITVVNLNGTEPFLWIDDEDYKPYIYKDKDGNPKGVFKDLMDELFKRINIPLKCELYPWKRSQKYVQDGKGDGMVTVPTESRLKFTKPTDPLVYVHEKIFVRSDNPKIDQIMKITKLEQFKDYKVIEYIGAGWSEEHYKNLDMVWVPKQSNAFIMLANKRGDIYVTSEFIGASSIKSLIKEKPQYKENLQKLIATPNSLTVLKFNLLIQKNSKYIDIIPKLNKALKQMKKDGTYDKILNKYLTI